MRLYFLVFVTCLVARPTSAAPCDVVQLATGYTHTIARLSDGSVWGWGNNSGGSLCRGDTAPTAFGPRRSLISSATFVAATVGVTLAVLSDGSLVGCGSNSSGELGTGTSEPFAHPTPQVIPGVPPCRAATAGRGFVLGLTTTGSVWGWGRHDEGQLTIDYSSTLEPPLQLNDLSDVTALAAGRAHALALLADGTVTAWGANYYGQLGDGTRVTTTPFARALPAPVLGLTNVVAIAAGEDVSFALRADGTVWSWGNPGGTLLGRTGDHTLPGQVPGVMAIAISASGWTAMVVAPDHSVWSWGDGHRGALGDGIVGSGHQSLVPVQAIGLSGADLICAGDANEIAAAGSSFWGWGANAATGTLGIPDGDDRAVPTAGVRGWDLTPQDQGQRFFATKAGVDARLLLQNQPSTTTRWQVYRDLTKFDIGLSSFGPILATPSFLDSGAAIAPISFFYYIRGLSECSGTPGP